MTNSILKTQLTAYVRQGRAEELCTYLSSLRNAHFRTASICLADASVWADAADFWAVASALVATNNRAYLGTVLKAALATAHHVPSAEFAAACSTDIDRKKVLVALLPKAATPAEVNALLRLFAMENDTAVEGLLFRSGTSASYFVLFNMLKHYEDQPDYLRRFGIELIRKGDKRSFNLACIIKEYFGLPELPGTFSLSLQPYELSRLDVSFDTFLTIINR